MRILFCGLSGIPNKTSASINRYLAIGQAISKNNEVIFINRFPLFKKEDYQLTEDISFKVIDATNTKFRPSSFLKRNILKHTSFIFEYVLIRKINKEKKIDWLNIYTQYFGIFIIYYFFSKIFKIKTILHYVEFRSKFINRSFLLRINDFLFDKYAVLWCDRIVPISTTLNDHVLKLKSNARTLIIPPICDFNYFASISPEISNRKYFIFCSSVSYDEVILFVIQSFLKTKTKEDITLHLVINGRIENESINQLVSENQNKIFLFYNLRYDDLIAKYKGSIAELIPLRNIIQDMARFPQKICEFLASNRPIITTPYGDISNYFIDNYNAVIANEYDIDCFSSKLDWAVTHPFELEVISENSYNTGLEFFNINGYSSKINDFLLQKSYRKYV